MCGQVFEWMKEGMEWKNKLNFLGQVMVVDG